MEPGKAADRLRQRGAGDYHLNISGHATIVSNRNSRLGSERHIPVAIHPAIAQHSHWQRCVGNIAAGGAKKIAEGRPHTRIRFSVPGHAHGQRAQGHPLIANPRHSIYTNFERRDRALSGEVQSREALPWGNHVAVGSGYLATAHSRRVGTEMIQKKIVRIGQCALFGRSQVCVKGRNRNAGREVGIIEVKIAAVIIGDHLARDVVRNRHIGVKTFARRVTQGRINERRRAVEIIHER